MLECWLICCLIFQVHLMLCKLLILVLGVRFQIQAMKFIMTKVLYRNVLLLTMFTEKLVNMSLKFRISIRCSNVTLIYKLKNVSGVISIVAWF